jgi:hypothetical protein
MLLFSNYPNFILKTKIVDDKLVKLRNGSALNFTTFKEPKCHSFF